MAAGANLSAALAAGLAETFEDEGRAATGLALPAGRETGLLVFFFVVVVFFFVVPVFFVVKVFLLTVHCAVFIVLFG